MNICCCVIFDGKDFHIGLSSAFEYPTEMTKVVFNEGLDISRATHKTGFTDKAYIGYAKTTQKQAAKEI